jgi:hypothetical protein
VALVSGERKAAERTSRLPAGQARAVIYLFLLNVVLFGLCFAGLIHYVKAGNSDRCTTLQQVIAIPVPTPVAGNPSREWESTYEAIDRQRARQLGCRP